MVVEYHGGGGGVPWWWNTIVVEYHSGGVGLIKRSAHNRKVVLLK